MTGKECIEWIRENNAEDKDIVFLSDPYDGEYELAQIELKHIGENSLFASNELRGKEVIFVG